MTKDQILAEAMALGPKEREQLVEELRQISDGGEVTAEQSTELRRRLEGIDRGEATFVAGDQVMREILEQLNCVRLGRTDRAAIDSAWLDEAVRREKDLARGQMSTSPVDQAVQRVRSRSPR